MVINCDFPALLLWNMSPALLGNVNDPFNREAMIFVPDLKLKRKFLFAAKFYCDCHPISVSGSFLVFLNFE